MIDTREVLRLALHECGELTDELDQGPTIDMARRVVALWRLNSFMGDEADNECAALRRALRDKTREVESLKQHLNLQGRYEQRKTSGELQ